MKKIILIFLATISYKLIIAQKELSLIDVMAYRGICEKYEELPSGWFSTLCRKAYGEQYSDAVKNKDEFKLNRWKTKFTEDWKSAKKNIKSKEVYYLIELVPRYKYDFTQKGIELLYSDNSGNKIEELDCYEQGLVSENYFYKETLSSLSNPALKISNFKNIPTFFEMKEDLAEHSFKLRTGKTRAPFKVKYFFTFWNCGELKMGSYQTAQHIEVTKVELIDEYTSFSKSYDVDAGEQPLEKTETNENTTSTEQSSNSENQNSETENNQNWVKTYSKQLNAEEIKQIEQVLDNYSTVRVPFDSFAVAFKQNSALCKKGTLIFDEPDFENLTYKAKEKKCLNLLGANKFTVYYYKGVLFTTVTFENEINAYFFDNKKELQHICFDKTKMTYKWTLPYLRQ